MSRTTPPGWEGMILKIYLSNVEYAAIQFALTKAANDRTLTDVGRLELLHLQTLLAEASVKEDDDDPHTSRCNINVLGYSPLELQGGCTCDAFNKEEQ